MTASSAWQRVSDIFGRGMDVPPDERPAWLDRECIDAPEIRAEVARLLQLHERTDDFLHAPSIVPAGSPSRLSEGLSMVGRTVGRYTIVRQIASGGMSVVFEAEQDSPRRRVALKMVHPTLISADLLRRLSFEAQILARLRHPGIAQIYEAGVQDLGDGAQPYFAMELINGEPVTTYAAAQRLDARGRIDLIVKIAMAVQHAHEKGVIHRDLKPANILVEAGAQPKVLDFGVARLTDVDVQAMTMQTEAGAIVGTLRYMSPEQLCIDPRLPGSGDIDTRADVFALGVVGYELLAGRLPYEWPSGTIASAIRVIEQGDIVPLGRVDTAFRGDLECIFAKALEHDRARRYGSAAELADDLQRYLNHEPVRARPATTMYQVRKFARRNRALVGGVAATVVATVVGLVLYAGEARRARQEAAQSRYEADKAMTINNFMTNDFLMKVLAAANAADPGERLSVAELVDQAALNVGTMFANEATSEAAVRNEIATIYYNLGAFEKSSQQFQIALEKWETSLGPEHPDTLKAVNNLGQTMMHLRRAEEAEALYRRALEGRVRVLGENDPFTLVTMNNLGTLYRSSGRLDEAEALLRRTLAIQEHVHGATHKNTLTTMGNLGSLLLDRGRVDEALGMHQRMYDSSVATLGADHATTLAAGSRFALTLLKAGRIADARSMMLEIVAAFERTLGPEHRSVLTARRTLARVHRAAGEYSEAKHQLNVALETARSWPPGSERLIAEIQEDLAEINEAVTTQPTVEP